MPGVEAGPLPVSRADDQLVVRHRVGIGRPPGVVPASPQHFLRRGVEDVEDVRRLAVADLDAERVDEHELVDPVAALDADLGGEPAAEAQYTHTQLLDG